MFEVIIFKRLNGKNENIQDETIRDRIKRTANNGDIVNYINHKCKIERSYNDRMNCLEIILREMPVEDTYSTIYQGEDIVKLIKEGFFNDRDIIEAKRESYNPTIFKYKKVLGGEFRFVEIDGSEDELDIDYLLEYTFKIIDRDKVKSEIEELIKQKKEIEHKLEMLNKM